MRLYQSDPEVQAIIENAAQQIKKVLGHSVIITCRALDAVEVDKIKDAVVSVTGISWEDIKSKKRKQEMVIARQLFCWFVRRYCSVMWQDIGLVIKRHHSTCIASYNKVKVFIDNNDPLVTPNYLGILEKLNKAA